MEKKSIGVYTKQINMDFHNSNQSYIDPKIILLGDSFAKGCCVNKENIPSNILEKKDIKH